MAVSAVVAVGAAVSYESSRKARSAQKRSDKKQQAVADQALQREKAQEKTLAKKEKALSAANSTGTAAQTRIAAERSYLQRGRRGRMASIKGGTVLG